MTLFPRMTLTESRCDAEMNVARRRVTTKVGLRSLCDDDHGFRREESGRRDCRVKALVEQPNVPEQHFQQ